MWTRLASLVLVISVSGLSSAQDDRSSTTHPLDGSWRQVSVLRGGELQESESLQLTVRGNTWRWQVPFEGDFSGVAPVSPRFTIMQFDVRYQQHAGTWAIDYLPGSSRSKRIVTNLAENPTSRAPSTPDRLYGSSFSMVGNDLVNDEGPAVTVPVIARLGTDVLTICEPDTAHGSPIERPKGFAVDEQSKYTLRVFARMNTPAISSFSQQTTEQPAGNSYYLYTSPYTISDTGTVKLPQGLSWSVETSWRGPSLPDTRVMLRLHNASQGFSAMTAQMDLQTAAQLHHDLGEVLIKKLQNPNYQDREHITRR